jgi:hypothetical protein
MSPSISEKQNKSLLKYLSWLHAIIALIVLIAEVQNPKCVSDILVCFWFWCP